MHVPTRRKSQATTSAAEYGLASSPLRPPPHDSSTSTAAATGRAVAPVAKPVCQHAAAEAVRRMPAWFDLQGRAGAGRAHLMPLSTIKLTALWARRTGGRKEPAASPPLHPSVCWCCRGRPTKPGPCQCRQRPPGPATQLLSLVAANATKRRRAQRHVLAARSAVGVNSGARTWMIQSTRDASAPKPATGCVKRRRGVPFKPTMQMLR